MPLTQHPRYDYLFCFCCLMRGKLIRLAHHNMALVTFCPLCHCRCTDEFIAPITGGVVPIA